MPEKDLLLQSQINVSLAWEIFLDHTLPFKTIFYVVLGWYS